MKTVQKKINCHMQGKIRMHIGTLRESVAQEIIIELTKIDMDIYSRNGNNVDR